MTQPDAKRLLLISNSTLHGQGYLDHAATEIKDFLGAARRVLFVPYALFDRNAYSAQARKTFELLGYQLDSVHEAGDPQEAVAAAEAIFIGGGNTFRLLNSLYQNGLIELIRKRAEEGMSYLGSSAGTNVAGPTIKTTNDMPIVQPPSFEALGLVNYQINPHYLDPDPTSKHMGETREERLQQFLEENETPVVGLREGTMLRVENGETLLKGNGSARIFRRGMEPIEFPPGPGIDRLLGY